MTVPRGRRDLAGYESTLKPALWSRATATRCASPTTFGTRFPGGRVGVVGVVLVVGPWETSIVTTVPFTARVPAIGSCETTTFPGGALLTATL
jgi:hypothetical protein